MTHRRVLSAPGVNTHRLVANCLIRIPDIDSDEDTCCRNRCSLLGISQSLVAPWKNANASRVDRSWFPWHASIYHAPMDTCRLVLNCDGQVSGSAWRIRHGVAPFGIASADSHQFDSSAGCAFLALFERGGIAGRTGQHPLHVPGHPSGWLHAGRFWGAIDCNRLVVSYRGLETRGC